MQAATPSQTLLPTEAPPPGELKHAGRAEAPQQGEPKRRSRASQSAAAGKAKHSRQPSQRSAAWQAEAPPRAEALPPGAGEPKLRHLGSRSAAAKPAEAPPQVGEPLASGWWMSTWRHSLASHSNLAGYEPWAIL